MGYKPRPLLFVINPKADKNQLVFQVQKFCFTELHKSQFESQTLPRSPNITLTRFVVLAGIRLDKKFLCSCEYI